MIVTVTATVMDGTAIQIPARPKPTIPDDFAALLRRMREDDHPDLSPLLKRVREAGWTFQEIADALGVTRQAVEQRIKFPNRKPRVVVPVDPKLVDKLRELHRTARTVNGGMSPDHPARRDSEELSRLLAEQVARGVSILALAKTLGVQHHAVALRLYRHGYSDRIAPSQSTDRYQNRKRGAVVGAAGQEATG